MPDVCGARLRTARRAASSPSWRSCGSSAAAPGLLARIVAAVRWKIRLWVDRARGSIAVEPPQNRDLADDVPVELRQLLRPAPTPRGGCSHRRRGPRSARRTRRRHRSWSRTQQTPKARHRGSSHGRSGRRNPRRGPGRRSVAQASGAGTQSNPISDPPQLVDSNGSVELHSKSGQRLWH